MVMVEFQCQINLFPAKGSYRVIPFQIEEAISRYGDGGLARWGHPETDLGQARNGKSWTVSSTSTDTFRGETKVFIDIQPAVNLW